MGSDATLLIEAVWRIIWMNRWVGGWRRGLPSSRQEGHRQSMTKPHLLQSHSPLTERRSGVGSQASKVTGSQTCLSPPFPSSFWVTALNVEPNCP